MVKTGVAVVFLFAVTAGFAAVAAPAVAPPAATAQQAAKADNGQSDPNSVKLTALSPAAKFLLIVIALAGAFGGLVDGLSTNKSYRFTIGSRSFELGSLGDMLIGTAAAVAIFAVAGTVFVLPTDANIYGSEGFVKLVAWGVLSGYLGTRLLDKISRKVVEQIATDVARQEVKDAVSQNEGVQQNIREAEQLVSQYLVQSAQLIAHKDETNAFKLLDGAVRKYELAKKTEPANAAAHIGLGNAHSYKAEFLEQALRKDPGEMWDKAIGAVTDLIGRDARSSKAFYNRACYKALAGKPVTGVVADLKRAFEIDANLKEYAQHDTDFDELRKMKNKEFDEIMGVTPVG